MSDGGESAVRFQGWGAKTVDDLREYLKQGLTASQIGGRLGVTRNAVLGKIHRLGLSSHTVLARRSGYSRGVPTPNGHPWTGKKPRKSRRKPKDPAQAGEPRARRLETLPKRVPEWMLAPTTLNEPHAAYMPPVEQMLTFEGLQDCHCRWPVGDPKAPEFRYCGGVREIGLSYCIHHVRAAYQMPKVPVANRCASVLHRIVKDHVTGGA